MNFTVTVGSTGKLEQESVYSPCLITVYLGYLPTIGSIPFSDFCLKFRFLGCFTDYSKGD